MTPKEAFVQMLATVRLGDGASLQPNEDGAALFSLSETLHAALTVSEHDGMIAYSSYPGPAPEPGDGIRLRLLLALGFATMARYSAALTMEPESGQLVLIRKIGLAGLDGPRFGAFLAETGTLAERVQAMLAELAKGVIGNQPPVAPVDDTDAPWLRI